MYKATKRRRVLIALFVALACVFSVALSSCSGNTSPESGATGSGEEAAVVDESTGKNAKFTALSLPTGAKNNSFEVADPEEADASRQDEVERAIRAYTPPADTLLKNNAKEYFFYDQLSKDDQKMYDALYEVACDPETDMNFVRYTTTMDPESDEFKKTFAKNYYAMCYDHPELFWLYQAIENYIGYIVPKEYKAGTPTDVYFVLDSEYANYEEEMTAFNNAAEEFLADIDTNASEPEIERQIHDKLVDMVTYDTETSGGDLNDLAHTAYGALVENSNGQKNTAVCDGYAAAYVYLLQQCGINAALVPGVAGDSADEAGGHAWNVVQLDGDWYEVDSTWDDTGTMREQVEALKDDYELEYRCFSEALDDADYSAKLGHYLYNVTTSTLSNYAPDDSMTYVTKDGEYTFGMVGESVHIRATEVDMGADTSVAELLPEATGTKYAFAL